MKKILALFLACSLLFTSNQFVFADNVETGSDVTYEQQNTEQDIITYLTVGNPSIEVGESAQIVVGLSDCSQVVSARMKVKNTDTDKDYESEGENTKEGNLLFTFSDLGKGCYSAISIDVDTKDGIKSIDLKEIGISAQFGVGTVVIDASPDAYAVDGTAEESDDSTNDNDIMALNDEGDLIATDSNSIGEAIALASENATANGLLRSSGKVTVVLDPGHGGKDGGAQASYNGRTYLEKTLNLKIAQYCKAELETYSNVSVYMTRSGDNFVELADRVEYARKVGATVFVAIHNNSSSSSKAHGATVYYPNSNYNANIGNQGNALAKSILSQLVALGLANNGTKIRNSESGDTYSDGSLCDYYAVIRKSKQAGFPGIIVEHAFISNASDAANYLGSDAALKKLGVADATGIANYFGLTHATPGTEYKGVNYRLVFDPDYYINKYPDIKKVFGGNPQGALEHFINNGIREGRRGCEEFDVNFYKNNNVDLQKAYGNDLMSYYTHFMKWGIGEGRQSSETFDVLSYRYSAGNADLRKAYGNDNSKYLLHYRDWGRNEHRSASPVKYTVTFKNGSETISTETVLCMRSATAPAVSQTGYNLSWDKSLNNITSDCTINAVWTPAKYNVKYDARGGHVNNAQKTVTYGSSYGDLENATRDGYVFLGWFTAADGGNQVTKDSKVTAVSDITVYAHWKANSYKVSFDSNGAQTDIADVTVTMGNKYGTLPVVTRSGYTFKGWWTIRDGGTQITDTSVVDIAGNHTLYAHWELNAITVSYQTHVRKIGWQSAVNEGKVAGTTGKGLQLEALKVKLNTEKDVRVVYTTHVQNDGWHGNSFDNETSGTVGQKKRIEAVMLKLEGSDADRYDIYYRVHARNYGWLAWAKNGAPAGTSGYSYRLEAIQIVITEKGMDAPSNSFGAVNTQYAKAYVSKNNDSPSISTNSNVSVQAHVSNIGWQNAVKSGNVSGTTGKSLGVEALRIGLENKKYSGGIQYQAHVKNVGWQSFMAKDNGMAGTTGKALSIEAIRISLTGEMANHYDVYYRVHSQDYGWLGWAKNGQDAGTTGLSKRTEAIQVILVEKGKAAPSNSYNGVTSVYSQAHLGK